MKMIYLINLIFCFNHLICLNKGINDYDIQSNDSKDFIKDDRTEFYGSDVIYADESGKSIKSKQVEVYFYT